MQKKGTPTFLNLTLWFDYYAIDDLCDLSYAREVEKDEIPKYLLHYRGAQQEYWGNFPGDLETKPGIRSRCIREVLDLELEKIHSNKHQALYTIVVYIYICSRVCRVRGEAPPNAVSYIHVTFLWMGMQEGWVLVPDSVSLLLWSQLLQDSNQTDQCFLSKLCLWRIFRMGIDLSVYNHTGHLSDARTLSNPLCSKAAGLFLPVSGILFRE